MKVNELKAADFNPRKINPTEFELLKKSLSDLADLSGIVYNRTTGHLVGGHQRLKWLLEVAPDAEVVITDELEQPTDSKTHAYGYIEARGDRFAVRVVEWPPEREILANLAANNISGQWEIDKLGRVLDNIAKNSEDMADLDLTGFSQDILKDYLENHSNLDRLITTDILQRYERPIDCYAPDTSISYDEEKLNDIEETELDENIEAKYQCPKCGYLFN